MFAVGQIPEGVQSTSFGFFLLFFYNQVLGLSGFLASLAIILAILVDAIGDPVIGAWSDGFRHRWGRRHPFMYAGAIPFALCFYCLFAPPDALSETQTFFWLLTFADPHSNHPVNLLNSAHSLDGGAINRLPGADPSVLAAWHLTIRRHVDGLFDWLANLF